MKRLVETTGKFTLVDMMSQAGPQHIERDRPSVVETTPFINMRISIGQLILVAELPDKATDAEFSSYWQNSQTREQAVESYKEALDPQPSSEESTKPKGKGGRPPKKAQQSQHKSEDVSDE